MIEKFKSLSKKKKIIVIVGTIVLLVLVIFIFKNRNGNEQTITIKTSNFVDQVSVSGKVVPFSNVELSFKNSGRIDWIYFSMDQSTPERQIVKAGAVIAQIDDKDAQESVHDAEIGLENAKLSLEKLKLESSDENLSSDLQKAYDDGFIAVSDAFIDLFPTITGLDDLLGKDNVSDNTTRNSGQNALDYKDEAESLYYKAKNAFQQNRVDFRVLDRNSPRQDIENIINETYDTTKIFMDAIKSTKNLVDFLAEDRDSVSEYSSSQDTLYEYTNTINEHLTKLLSIKTSIKDYKDAFSYSDLDIQSSLLSVKQKENALREARNELADYYIRAPFDGIITKIDAKVGEMASANTPLISIMSADTFQIESFVPEVNIAQIKLWDEAKITLDAYGEDVYFKAKVISIDPAETIRDGVSTYKVRLQFIEKDDRIKSGMTANVAVTIFSKPNVIVIPESVTFEKDSKKFVQVKKNRNIIDKEIVLGEMSSLGQAEVLSGLSDGEVVILNPQIK